MQLEDEYNYNILLRMTSENFEEIFQLIKDDITKGNTKIKKTNPVQTRTCNHNYPFIDRRIIQELFL